MDQLAFLKSLEKFAAFMRGYGLPPLLNQST
jgi:hypothetical protein